MKKLLYTIGLFLLFGIPTLVHAEENESQQNFERQLLQETGKSPNVSENDSKEDLSWFKEQASQLSTRRLANIKEDFLSDTEPTETIKRKVEILNEEIEIRNEEKMSIYDKETRKIGIEFLSILAVFCVIVVFLKKDEIYGGHIK